MPSAIETAVHRSIYDAKKDKREAQGPRIRGRRQHCCLCCRQERPKKKKVFEYFGNAYQFFSEVFGHNSIDGKGLHLTAIVHYDDISGPPGMDNAFGIEIRWPLVMAIGKSLAVYSGVGFQISTADSWISRLYPEYRCYWLWTHPWSRSTQGRSGIRV